MEIALLGSFYIFKVSKETTMNYS
ncbi:hypothetical protein tpqmel_1056, partial [Candidatus Gastranaerophilus sp. (ex Termes propinquus)]